MGNWGKGYVGTLCTIFAALFKLFQDKKIIFLKKSPLTLLCLMSYCFCVSTRPVPTPVRVSKHLAQSFAIVHVSVFSTEK